MCNDQVLFNPVDEMVFECPFDDLVEKIGGKQFVYVCPGKVSCKRLQSELLLYKASLDDSHRSHD